jgi:hypothetical protein
MISGSDPVLGLILDPDSDPDLGFGSGLFMKNALEFIFFSSRLKEFSTHI